MAFLAHSYLEEIKITRRNRCVLKNAITAASTKTTNDIDVFVILDWLFLLITVFRPRATLGLVGAGSNGEVASTYVQLIGP